MATFSCVFNRSLVLKRPTDKMFHFFSINNHKLIGFGVHGIIGPWVLIDIA